MMMLMIEKNRENIKMKMEVNMKVEMGKTWEELEEGKNIIKIYCTKATLV